jgi:hypothetical protein
VISKGALLLKPISIKEAPVEERPDEDPAIDSEVKQLDIKKELHGAAQPPANEGAVPSN